MLKIKFLHRIKLLAAISAATFMLIGPVGAVRALTPAPGSPNPQNNSVGLEGTISAPPPSTPATVSVPTTGQAFSNEPITISGLCTGNLIVKVYSNGVFIGSTECSHNSYSVVASLFNGKNELSAQVFDALGQAGPLSNIVTVGFSSNAPPTAPQLLLTSAYASRGADPGSVLTWPITVSGGVAPYAISVDWGDSTSPEVVSQVTAGTFTIHHTFKQAGVYHVLIKASDQNGTEAYLQLVAIGNGTITQSGSSLGRGGTTVITHTTLLWWPAVAIIALLPLAFWLGGRYAVVALRRRLDRTSEHMQDQI